MTMIKLFSGAYIHSDYIKFAYTEQQEPHKLDRWQILVETEEGETFLVAMIPSEKLAENRLKDLVSEINKI